MDPVRWVDLVLAISTGTCAVWFIQLYVKTKSLLELYFAAAALILCIPYLIDFFLPDAEFDVFVWGKLIAVITYISGLLVLIRESKPVFARFPVYLTALPFISIMFFPFVIESIVIKELLNAIYQGGALTVTGLIFTINYANEKGRRYYLLGIGAVIAAYLGYWLYFTRFNTDYIWIAEVLFAGGIIITAYKFINGQIEKLNLRPSHE